MRKSTSNFDIATERFFLLPGERVCIHDKSKNAVILDITSNCHCRVTVDIVDDKFLKSVRVADFKPNISDGLDKRCSD